MALVQAFFNRLKHPIRSTLSLRAGVIACVSAACLSLVGAGSLQNIHARGMALVNGRSDTANLARSIAQHVEDTIQTVDTQLAELVERLESDDAAPDQRARLSRLLSLRTKSLPVLSGMFVYDETGQRIASSLSPPGAPHNSAGRAYFDYHRDHPDRSVHLDSPVQGASLPNAAIPISRRYNHPDGSFAGVVLAVVDVEYFERFYATFDIGAEGTISLVQKDGLLVVRRPFDTRDTGRNFTPQSVAQAQLQPVGSFEGRSAIDGVLRLTSYRRIDRLGLIAFVSLSKDEVLAPWHETALHELIGVSVLAGIIGLLGLYLGSQIKHRQEAENSVREMADAYRMLTDTSTDMILRTDLSGIRQYVSPASMEMLGYRPEELIGRPSFSLTHPDDMPEQSKIISALVAGQVDTTNQTYRLRHKQGHWIWVETKFRLLRDPATGKPIARVSSVRDITDRHNAEQAMRESETRLRAMADGVRDLIIRVDREGRRHYVSAASRDILGYEPEELLGDRQISFVHPDDRSIVANAHRDLLAGLIAPFVTARAVRKDGTLVWLEARSSVIREPGSDDVTEYVSVLRDVTRQRTIEKQLEHARIEAEAASQAKSEFLANMSHEIRTPMNGIIGMNQLLLNSDLAADQRKYAEAVHLSADALLAIINDILDLSKLEAGKIELDTVDFYLEDVVDEAADLLSPKAHQKGLTLAAYVCPAARQRLQGDVARLRQVLLNLLTNAVKFTDQGFIEINVSGQPASDGRTRLRLEIRDTGIGLAAAAREKLFQKFQQADGSITRRFGGTGLGLAISKQLVELMGGRIGVDSNLGHGSVFWVDLALPTVTAALTPAYGATTQLAGRRALVIDDVGITRQVVQRQLDADGMIVETAESAASAVTALQQASDAGRGVDVILVDPSGFGLGMLEIAAMLRRAAGEPPPRLVLLTALGAQEPIDAESRAAFDAALTKPVRHRELSACLTRLLSADETTLPKPTARKAVATQPRPPIDAGSATAGKRVLVAEDNEINRLLVTTLLEGAGYTVETAHDGLLAIEAVRRHSYDLILMDVQMPNADGVQATRAIRSLAEGRGRMPIVALTANAMAGDREIYLQACMNDYLSKPLDHDLLLRVIARWIGAATQTAGDTDNPPMPTLDEPEAAPVEPLAVEIEPVIDRAVIEKLRSMMPDATFQGIVADYTDWGRQQVEKFEAAPPTESLADVARLAHDLRGSSGTLGAQRLSAIAARLETACAARQAATATALIAELRIAADDTWMSLSHWLPPILSPGEAVHS